MPDRWEERALEYSRLLNMLTPDQRREYDRAVGEVYRAQDAAEVDQVRADRDAEWQRAWDGNGNGLGPKTPEELRIFREEAAQVDREQREHERRTVKAICLELLTQPHTPALTVSCVERLWALLGAGEPGP